MWAHKYGRNHFRRCHIGSYIVKMCIRDSDYLIFCKETPIALTVFCQYSPVLTLFTNCLNYASYHSYFLVSNINTGAIILDVVTLVVTSLYTQFRNAKTPYNLLSITNLCIINTMNKI